MFGEKTLNSKLLFNEKALQGLMAVKIKAVLFDLGGTLVKGQPVSEVTGKILKAQGIERSTEEIEQARTAAEKNVDIGELPILGEAFWHKWNGHVLNNLGIRDNVPFLAERIAKLWWQYSDVELYPDARETLRLLRQGGLKIGLVTNGLESDVREILSKVGLTGFFDVEIASDTVGKIKPCKEMFLHAITKLGIQPQEVIFVGDSVEHDYRGAKKCGLKALLIDRDDSVKEEDVEKIGSLTELLEYV